MEHKQQEATHPSPDGLAKIKQPVNKTVRVMDMIGMIQAMDHAIHLIPLRAKRPVRNGPRGTIENLDRDSALSGSTMAQ